MMSKISQKQRREEEYEKRLMNDLYNAGMEASQVNAVLKKHREKVGSELVDTRTTTMTNGMEWSNSFCLACDKQTDGDVYCSEACRLAEYKVASTRRNFGKDLLAAIGGPRRVRTCQIVETEEHALKKILKERMMPKRRFSVKLGQRRHRVLYNDRVYR